MLKYKVSYDTKDKKGFLIVKTQKFPTLSSAMGFARELAAKGVSIGKPELSKTS